MRASSGIQLVEGDDTGVRLAVGTHPGDARVGDLLGDFGIEFALHSGNGHLPVRVAVVQLNDLIDSGRNCGNDSNWVDWLYAVLTGTATSISALTVLIEMTFFRRFVRI